MLLVGFSKFSILGFRMTKALKILGWVLATIVLLIVGTIIYLQTPHGKKTVTKLVVNFLEKKFQTEVYIGAIDYKIPSMVDLQKVMFLDRNRDTLLSLNRLEVDIRMLSLLRNKLKVYRLEMDGLYARMRREQNDTFFNYQYIIDAFASAQVGTEEPVEDTSATAMLYDIDKVILKNITFIFDDEAGGTYFDLALDSLLLRPKEIDPAKMVYRVEDLVVYRAQSLLHTFPATLVSNEQDEDTASSPLILEAKNLKVIQSSYTMLTRPDSFYLDVDVGRLEAKIDLFDLHRELINADGLNLVSTQVVMSLGKSIGEESESKSEPEVHNNEPGWIITANKINLADIAFQMDDPTAPHQPAGMDYSHLNVSQLSLILDDLRYTADTISGDLTHFAAKEKSGLDLREMRTRFVYHAQGAVLENLYVLTPSTLIQDHIQVRYPSLEALASKPEQMFVDIRMNQSRASINDILIFTPYDMRSMLLPYDGQSVTIDGIIVGHLNDLVFKQFRVEGLSNTALSITGSLKGLPNPDRLVYDFEVQELHSGFKDVKPFIPASVLDNIYIPETFSALGTIRGTLNAYHPDLKIVTSEGNVDIVGMVDITHSGAELFDLNFSTYSLNIGKILKQDTLLGMVTMTGHAKGKGFDIQTMHAEIKGDVQRFDFQGNAYSNVHLDGRIAGQVADIQLNAKDPNAHLDLVAQVDLKGEHPAVVSTAQIHNIDLQALGFTPAQVVLGGNIFVDFSDLNPDRPVGFLSWKNPLLFYDGRILDVDSIYLSSQPDSGYRQNIVAFIPEMLKASLTGNIRLTQIGNVALGHINRYFTITDTLDPVLEQYDFDLHFGLRNHPTLSTFFPELKRLDTIGVEANVSPSTFYLSAFSPKLIYGEHTIDNFRLYAHDSTHSRLDYRLTLDKYQMGKDGLRAFNPTLSGYMRSDSLLAVFNTTDSVGIENYAIGVRAYTLDNIFYASLLPSLKLNYDLWDVGRNRIVFSVDSGFYINNLRINKGEELVSIQSREQRFGSPLDVQIRNFELANLSRILDPNNLLVEGKLYTDAELDFTDSFPLFTGKVNVQDLALYQSPIGILSAGISNDDANTYRINSTITELGNDIHLSGFYYLEPVKGSNFDLDLKIGALDLKRFEGAAMGYIRDSEGLITGNLKLTGTTEAPRVNGLLQTQNLQTKVSMFNSLYRMPNEKIEFSDGMIRFADFKLLDTFNNEAVISGTATTRDYSAFDLNLKFKSNRWMLSNSTNADYENFYGKLLLTSSINITGTATAPIIDGSVTLHDSTNFTYANVDEGPGLSDMDGIVMFVDDVENYKPPMDSTSVREVENQMTLNLNIETEKYARFNVLVDPITGDKASVFGNAFLNASMLPGGTFGLTGTYQISGGYYELFIELIRRQFKIREGSTIQLVGDPFDAELNLEAYYEAFIAPYDLMEKTASQDELVYYKQRLPFEILLKITGKPLKPNISFDIVLVEDKANSVGDDVANNVQAKLRALQTDVAEMNKQVFGILVLGRFLSEDPMSAGSPISMEYYARQSASRFLSQQLNNLASRYVNGLELSLDVQSQEDYTTGKKENRTSVNVQASKRFFNDRLTVNVGNDFQVEGRQMPGRENALIPGNISLDYKLTPDGKYVLRGYRKNEIQNVVDGYVVETGTALRLNYEYNRFKQLFVSREKLREARRREMEHLRRKQEEEENKQADQQSEKDNIDKNTAVLRKKRVEKK